MIMFFLLGWFGAMLWICWQWLLTVNSIESFNLIGGLFGITMVFILLKVWVVSIALFIEWALPKLNDKFKGFKFNWSSFTIFNKTIEISIRIVDRKRSKVTF